MLQARGQAEGYLRALCAGQPRLRGEHSELPSGSTRSVIPDSAAAVLVTPQFFDKESLDFQEKILNKSALSEETFFPPGQEKKLRPAMWPRC